MEYKAEDFISFIENNRRDKVSPNGLELIAKRFRELESEVNKLSLGAVSGRSEQLHLCPVCNEKAGKSYLLSKLPTICQKCDHAWNRA